MYLEDTYLFEKKDVKFIEVRMVGEDESKLETVVITESTIFHPQGGGQPSDTGIMKQGDSVEFKVSKVSKGIEQIKTSAIVSPNKSVLKSSDEIEGTRVKSPIIGTAYLAPEPGAKKFVEVGDKIKKGQTVMIVEAMKTMNHVPSTADGIVKEICVEDGQPVEFGQTIVILD